VTGGTGETRRRPDGERARRQRLVRLRAALSGLQTRLGAVQAELRALAAAETTRRLSADEARRVARLRLASKGLRLELAALRREFAGARPDVSGRP
jgi:hypothetical protein